MRASTIARIDSVARPILSRALPPSAVVKLYSAGRKYFLARFEAELPEHYQPPAPLARTLWGIPFRTPVMNASGMFKNGQCYALACRQGAGAFLAGTSTAVARSGNERNGIRQPFLPYPRSRSSSNWMGLPNDGDLVIAERLAAIRKVEGCPVGASIAASPELAPEERLERLIAGLIAYQNAGVDFIELNESCPNTDAEPNEWAAIDERLGRIAERFLAQRTRTLPVIVKYSSDTDPAMVPQLISRLTGFGFDGVNFGNTSTAYARHRAHILPAEQGLYDFFTGTFGGGVGGAALKAPCMTLVRSAAAALRTSPPGREFHIIRTGGVEDAEDVAESLSAGASLVQWYTGYFEAFARHGHDLYRQLYTSLSRRSDPITTDSDSAAPARARS